MVKNRCRVVPKTEQVRQALQRDILTRHSDVRTEDFKFNMYSVQLAVKTQLIYCTVCTMYKNYMFRPILAIFRFFV